MKNFNYFPAKFITKNFILIDGISRTGKLLLGSLICSFDRMESLEFGENFEHLLPAVKFKKVNKRFAKAFLHNYLNQLIYNKFISRNVNFRLNDRTSIEQSRNPKIYYKRLKNLDGDIVLGRIQKEEPIIPIVTHDLCVNLDTLKILNFNFKMIEILRSPIEIVYSWYKRGLGRRYGKDKRIFTLLIEKKKIIYPWYNALIKKNLDKENEIEKCITIVETLVKNSVSKLRKSKSKIFVTTYDLITQDTRNEIEKISLFLNTKTNNQTYKFIKKENCPINYNEEILKKKFLFIQKKSSIKKFKKLIELEKQYRKNLYSLRTIKI